MKEKALAGVNTLYMALPGQSTPKVPAMLSLAVRPASSATAGCHEPKPHSVKTGAAARPAYASMLWELSPAKVKSGVTDCKSHIITVAAKTVVPARFKKFFTLSHVCFAIPRGDGMR